MASTDNWTFVFSLLSMSSDVVLWSLRGKARAGGAAHWLENQNGARSFAPPRWGHLAEPWWIGVRQATPQRFMIKAYYVGKLTLIADLNCWNQLICSGWIEIMVNSVCQSDRLNGKKPGKREGTKWTAGHQLCLKVVQTYHVWLTADTGRKIDWQKRRMWRAKPSSSHWSE